MGPLYERRCPYGQVMLTNYEYVYVFGEGVDTWLFCSFPLRCLGVIYDTFVYMHICMPLLLIL